MFQMGWFNHQLDIDLDGLYYLQFYITLVREIPLGPWILGDSQKM